MKNVLRSPKGGIGERERMRGMLMGKGEVAGARGGGGAGGRGIAALSFDVRRRSTKYKLNVRVWHICAKNRIDCF